MLGGAHPDILQPLSSVQADASSSLVIDLGQQCSDVEDPRRVLASHEEPLLAPRRADNDVFLADLGLSRKQPVWPHLVPP